jgi:zinc transport system permease protein
MISIFQYDFMRYALIAGALASVACGIIGVYVVTKRIVSISSGIAHSAFGGVGLGYLLGINPVWGALMFTLPASLGMGLITRRGKLAEDTAIGMLWSLGMALGIIFVGLTPGYAPGLTSYLFGNILIVPVSDLWLMLAVDILIILVVLGFYREFQGLSFDEEMSQVLGMPVDVLYYVLLGMIAVTVVILIRIVGIILVIALLTVPAALARQLSHNMAHMMAIAIVLNFVFTFSGLLISFYLNLASGATIVIVSCFCFFTFMGVRSILRRLAG